MTHQSTPAVTAGTKVNRVMPALMLLAAVGTATPAGSQAFDPAFSAAANGLVHAVAVLPDGKILIGGDFTQVNGIATGPLARLNPDGSLDGTFTAHVTRSVVGHNVTEIDRLPDGRIVIAGGFAQVNSVSRPLIACLFPDGALDTSFTPSVPDLISALFVQPDGRIVIGGRFASINGVTRSRVARLNSDGTLDGAFAPAVTGFVYAIAREADGSLLLGGTISAVNGVARSGLARVATGGALDTAFSITIDRPNGEWIEAVAVRPDGRILIGGVFDTVNGVSRPHLAQIHPNGTLDTSFDARPDSNQLSVNNGFVRAMALQPDGRLVFGGVFSRVNGIPTYSVTRVLADGALDYTFGISAGAAFTETLDIALQPDGKILIAGNIGDTEVARLLATATANADPRLTMTASPEPVAPGGTLTLTLTVANAGTTQASGVTVSTTLPAGLTFVSCTAAGGTCGGTGNDRTITYPAIAGGTTRTITIGTMVSAGPGATILTTATVASQSPDVEPGNNTATVTSHTTVAAVADVEVTMGVTPVLIDPSTQVAFVIGVRNNGTLSASNVVVTDTLPAAVTFVSCTAPNGTCGGSGNTRTVAFGTLAGGASRTITLLATVGSQATGTATNTAVAATTTTDAVPTNNTASVTIRIGDTDQDGLPTWWELRFKLDPTSPDGDDGAAGDPDGDGRTNTQEFAGGTHPRGFHVSYLAEGAKNAFFDARLAVLNVGTGPGILLFRFLRPGGHPIPHVVELPQNRRITIGNEVLATLNSPDFSTVLESDQPIVLDRTMKWNGGVGSHAETGVPSPASTWYLAEGSTSAGFSLFYLLQNPNPAATVATVRYLLPSGQPPITRTYALLANSRTTIPVNTQGGVLAATDVSAVITTPLDAPIIVERAMYRSTPTTAFAAGHGSTGVTAPATSWFLAEGATGVFFDCFILLANPGASPANVVIDYLLDNGQTFTKNYTVPAEGRFTVWVDDEQIPAGSGIRPLASAAVSSTITSSVPIIVERAMWWPGPAITPNFWTEAHNSPGATATGTLWALAEGEVGGAENAETYVLIANTSTTAGSARVTLYFADGTSTAKTVPLLPRSRRNVSVSTEFPTRPTTTFSVVVESLPAGGNTAAQIVVERAMYTSPGGAVWEAGTNALATPIAAAPSRLTVTFTPNPITAVGTPSCVTGTIRNWYWDMTVRNTGDTPFVVASLEVTDLVTGFPPQVRTFTAGDFAILFGSATVAPGATLHSLLPPCGGLFTELVGEWTISWLIRAQSGETVRSPTLRLLP